MWQKDYCVAPKHLSPRVYLNAGAVRGFNISGGGQGRGVNWRIERDSCAAFERT
jgi:hypothetical protein